MAGKEILINKVFAGKYAKMGANIVHETINLFEADGGRNYVFITNGAAIPKYHDLEAIVFVEHSTSRKAKIVAVAKEPERFGKADFDKIAYKGVPLLQLFHGNQWYGAPDEGFPDAVYAAKEMWLPKNDKETYISLDGDDEGAITLAAPGRNCIVGRTMRWYLSAHGKYPKAYEKLHELVSSGALNDLCECNPPKRRLETIASRGIKPSFLEIIRKEDDELAFSNLLSYYLTYDANVLHKFITDFLEIKGMSISCGVKREYKQIDLLIQDKSHAIVIENKIGANVIIRQNGLTQLDDYYDSAKPFARNNEPDCFLFVPDYREREFIPIIEELDSRNKPYKIKTYSELLGFFSNNVAAFADDENRFGDFLQGLRRHAVKTLADHDLELMRSRFLQRIHECQLTV